MRPRVLSLFDNCGGRADPPPVPDCTLRCWSLCVRDRSRADAFALRDCAALSGYERRVCPALKAAALCLEAARIPSRGRIARSVRSAETATICRGNHWKYKRTHGDARADGHFEDLLDCRTAGTKITGNLGAVAELSGTDSACLGVEATLDDSGNCYNA